MSQPNKEEKVVRFGCGVMLGLLVAFVIAVQIMPISYKAGIAILITSMAICGYLAMREGDSFWQSVAKILKWMSWI